MKRVVPLIVTALFTLATVGPGQAPLPTAADPLVVQLADGNERMARKMSGRLMQLRHEVKSGRSTMLTAAEQMTDSLRGKKLQVILVVDDFSEDLIAAATSGGLEIVGKHHLPHNTRHLVVRCTDPTQLDSLLERDDVKIASLEPRRVCNTGAALSQADASIRGALARSSFFVDGTGVRVGVLSDTFNRTIGGTVLPEAGSGTVTGSAPQLSGDLPSSIRVIDAGPNDGSGSDEGAGMAELIHDLAPGAAISFASAFTGYSQFAANITGLRTDPGMPCNVIVDDVVYYNEPMYQHGYIALAANQCFAAGVPYFSAAGNFYDDAHEADFTDTDASESTAYPPTGVDFHDFGAAKGAASDKFLTFNLGPGITLECTLKWDEPGNGIAAAGPGSQSDLNLYIVSSTTLPITVGTILDKGVDVQGTVASPSGEPFEQAWYTNTSSTNKTVHVVIDHRRGRTPVRLHLMALTDGPYSGYVDRVLDTGRTGFGHAMATDAMAVAAVRYKELDLGGNDVAPSDNINVEQFSSLAGATPLHISDDGYTRYSTPLSILKPDITAPDGTNTTFFPPDGDDSDDADTYPNFYGTSAAAPHAAAVAALMLDAKPGLSATEIYSTLKATAIDIEALGVDGDSGAGVIDAFNAVHAVITSGIGDWSLY